MTNIKNNEGCESKKTAPNKIGEIPSPSPCLDYIDDINYIIDRKIEEIAETLIEENPEDYYLGYESYGWYHNGVGMASCGGEKVYDEDRAWNDASEKLAIDTANGGDDYELLYNEKFLTAIAKYIRSR